MYGVWTKKIYMMITLTYLGQVHTTYDFDQTLNAHNSKQPILPLSAIFWIDLWINKCLLWPKLLTITIISAYQRDFCKFWLFGFLRRGQSADFSPKCIFFLWGVTKKNINCKKNPSDTPKLQVPSRVSETEKSLVPIRTSAFFKEWS